MPETLLFQLRSMGMLCVFENPLSILLGTKPARVCCSGKVLLSLANNKGASGWLKKHIFGSQNKSRLSSRSLSGIDSDDSIDTRGSPLSMVRPERSVPSA